MVTELAMGVPVRERNARDFVAVVVVGVLEVPLVDLLVVSVMVYITILVYKEYGYITNWPIVNKAPGK